MKPIHATLAMIACLVLAACQSPAMSSDSTKADSSSDNSAVSPSSAGNTLSAISWPVSGYVIFKTTSCMFHTSKPTPAPAPCPADSGYVVLSATVETNRALDPVHRAATLHADESLVVDVPDTVIQTLTSGQSVTLNAVPTTYQGLPALKYTGQE